MLRRWNLFPVFGALAVLGTACGPMADLELGGATTLEHKAIGGLGVAVDPVSAPLNEGKELTFNIETLCVGGGGVAIVDWQWGDGTSFSGMPLFASGPGPACPDLATPNVVCDINDPINSDLNCFGVNNAGLRHTYADNSTYAVNVLASDGIIDVTFVNVNVPVLNVAPVVSSLVRTGFTTEGSQGTFNAKILEPGFAPGEIRTVVWTFAPSGTVHHEAVITCDCTQGGVGVGAPQCNDGADEPLCAMPLCVPGDRSQGLCTSRQKRYLDGPAVYTASLTVTDKDGGSNGLTPAGIPISNLSPGSLDVYAQGPGYPVPTIMEDYFTPGYTALQLIEGSTYTMSLDIGEPGADQLDIEYLWTWDGSIPPNGADVTGTSTITRDSWPDFDPALDAFTSSNPPTGSIRALQKIWDEDEIYCCGDLGVLAITATDDDGAGNSGIRVFEIVDVDPEVTSLTAVVGGNTIPGAISVNEGDTVLFDAAAVRGADNPGYDDLTSYQWYIIHNSGTVVPIPVNVAPNTQVISNEVVVVSGCTSLAGNPAPDTNSCELQFLDADIQKTYTVSVRVFDEDSSVETGDPLQAARRTVTVNNVRPGQQVPPAQTLLASVSNADIVEGGSSALTVEFTDPALLLDGPYTLHVLWGDGSFAGPAGQTFTPQGGSGAPYTFTTPAHTYNDNAACLVSSGLVATCRISAWVCEAGDTLCSPTRTIDVTVRNQAPTVTVTYPEHNPVREVVEGVPFNLQGNFSDPGLSYDELYAWAWTGVDAQTAPATLSGTSTYAARANAAWVTNGGYYIDNTTGSPRTITLTVTDKDGVSGNDQVNVTVRDNVPAMTIDALVLDNGDDELAIPTITVSATAETPADLISQFEVTWGDGSSPQLVTLSSPAALVSGLDIVKTVMAPGMATAHYPDSGTYTVTVRVRDEDSWNNTNQHGTGGTVATRAIMVNNVAPTEIAMLPAAGSTVVISEGQSASFVFTFTDESVDDINHLSFVFDWGDTTGETVAGVVGANVTGRASHTFPAPASYTVTAWVRDNDWNVPSHGPSVQAGPYTFTVEVVNVAPVLTDVFDTGPITEGSDATVVALVDNRGADVLFHEFQNGGLCNPAVGGVDEADFANKVVAGNPPPGGPSAVAIFHYPDNGSTNVCVRVCDDDDLPNSCVYGFTTVTVDNVAPHFTSFTATPATSTELPGGRAVVLAATATDPGADTLTYAYNCGNGQLVSTCNYAQSGVYTATCTVTDDDGALDMTSVTVRITNVAPANVSVSGPATSNEGQQVTLTVTATDADALNYAFDWLGNGLYSPAAGASASYTYMNNGSYTVGVRVTDEDGAVTQASHTITVANVVPTIASVTPATQTIDEGQMATLTVAASDVGSDTLSYEFTWGDGAVTTQAGTVANHVYADNRVAPFTVQVVAIDSDGGRSLTNSTATVTVTNLMPSVTLATPAGISEGDTLVVNAVGTGGDGALTYAFDWNGDAVFDTVQSTGGASHLYPADGTFNLTVRVTDGDGEQASVTVPVVVGNAAPVIGSVVHNPTAPIDEGNAVTVQVFATDAGNDALTYEFDWNGDNVYDTIQATSIATHVYPVEGSFSVHVRVSDGVASVVYGGTITISVTNLVPIIDAVTLNSATIDEGGSLTVNVLAHSGDGALMYEFDWNGDGAYETMQPFGMATHVYPMQGTYIVGIKVTDADGTSTEYTGTDPRTVTVNNVAPVITNVTATSPVTAGSSVTVTVTATDIASDTLTYSFDWDNDGTFDVSNGTGIAFHTYDSSGSYTVAVRVSDGDDTDTDSVGITVTDLSVTLVVTAIPATLNEGGSSTVRVAPTGTGPYLISWDWNGDGLYDAGAGDLVDEVLAETTVPLYLERSHTFTNDGQPRVNVRVIDQGAGNAVAASSVTLRVNNVNPTITSTTPPVTATEGVAYVFTVVATDPGTADQAALVYALPVKPAGMSINPSTGAISWTPTYHAAGSNAVSATASDPQGGMATLNWNVAVTVIDSDGDGIADGWEMDKFGNLTTASATTDSDDDGVSDLDEFLRGTDPLVSDYNAPTAPVALSPVEKYVATLQPTLVVSNATDPDGDALEYTFEVFDNENFTGTASFTVTVNEGTGTTTAQVDVDLTDGARYWWRAIANDGVFDGPYSETTWFVVSVANNAPGVPVLLLPVDGASVSTLRPTLELRAVTDPDMDAVTYDLQVYDAESMAANSLIVETTGLVDLYWAVSLDLTEDTTYWWRARALDDQGAASAWSGLYMFTVNTQAPANTAPPAPAIVLPAIDATVATLRPYLEVTSVQDVDGDAVSYAFRVYSDQAMATQVAAITGRGMPTWFVDVDLVDGQQYWWVATASDGMDTSAASNTGHFTVTLPVVVVNTAPSTPVLTAPTQGAVVTDTTPTLTVTNSTDAEGDELSYYFEVAANAGFVGISLQASAAVAEGTDTTAWTPTTALHEDAMFFWRARASDGQLMSDWVVGTFTVNAANGTPSIPVPLSPGVAALLQAAPTHLVAQNAMDPEGDALTYSFEIAADVDGTNVLSASGAIAEGSGSTSWLIEGVTFVPGTTYYWRVQASDGARDSGFSDWVAFTLYKAPVIPAPTPTPPEETGGCGCASNQPVASGSIALLTALVLVLRRRRR
ncbi:MAG: PKD domain-containing protein [Pseudomonadota bacterium]